MDQASSAATPAMDLSSHDNDGPTKRATGLAQVVFGLRRYRGATATAQSVKRDRWSLCDRDLHSPLHLLEGTHLDLPHALARDAELHRQILERHRIIGELARLEDAPLALAEHRERLAQRLPAVVRFLVFDE